MSIQNLPFSVFQIEKDATSRVTRISCLLALMCCIMMSFTIPSHATGYNVSITPENDSITGNSKVRIGGERFLKVHVTKTPSNSNAANIPVYFSTTRGSVSGQFATTDANGKTGVTLNGGWAAGSATVRAKVVVNDVEYPGVANVAVVTPSGEDTSFFGWGRSTQFPDVSATQGIWIARLSPMDVNFDGLVLTEGNGGVVGKGDTCWFRGNDWGYDKYESVTGSGKIFDTVHDHNWWGYDGVGYGAAMVTNYRSAPSVPIPCGTQFLQVMKVVVPGATNIQYTTNILGAGIQPVTVTSLRDGKSAEKPY